MKTLFIFLAALLYATDQYKCGNWLRTGDEGIDVQYCHKSLGNGNWSDSETHFRLRNYYDYKVQVTYYKGSSTDLKLQFIDADEEGIYTGLDGGNEIREVVAKKATW